MHTHQHHYEPSAEHLLKSAGLRTTDQRLTVLQALVEAGTALSHGELERRIGAQLDRVTLYRTLRTFVDKDLLHQVLDKKDGVRYALCAHHCAEHKAPVHNHNHLHFTCRKCEGTFCLESVVIPSFTLPSGYTAEEANLVVSGVCERCKV